MLAKLTVCRWGCTKVELSFSPSSYPVIQIEKGTLVCRLSTPTVRSYLLAVALILIGLVAVHAQGPLVQRVSHAARQSGLDICECYLVALI